MFTDPKLLERVAGNNREMLIGTGSSFEKLCQKLCAQAKLAKLIKALPLAAVMAAGFGLTGCAALNSKSNTEFGNLNHQVSSSTKPAIASQSRINSTKLVIATDNASQIGRYVTINNDATRAQVNPLLAVSTFTFNPSVATVGEAVRQVLANTGYQLAPNLSSDVTQTLAKALPITNRHLGPLSIQATLEILMGEEVFTLQRDPLHRLVNFKVKPSIAKALGVKDE